MRNPTQVSLFSLIIVTAVSSFSLRILKDQAEPGLVIPSVITNGEETIPVTIGTAESNLTVQTFSMDFGLGEYSYVNFVNCTSCPLKRFDPSLSKTGKLNGTKVKLAVHPGLTNLSVNGSLYWDTMNLTTYTSAWNYFILADFNSLGNDGMLSFPLDYSDPNYDNTSVFDQVLKQNKNDKKLHRVLAHKVISDTEGRFFLGAYPNELTNGNLPFTKCKANADGSCKIGYVNFGNYNKLSDGHKLGNETTNHDNAYFSLSFEEIIAPNYVLAHFNSSFFSNKIDNTNCSLVELSGGISKVTCTETFVNSTNFTDIHFAFDEAAYRLNATSGFFRKETSGNHTFVIGFHNSSKSWTFGSKFLKNYIVVFDGDNQNIGFYGADIKDFSSSTGIMVVIIIIAVLILVFAIVFLVCICRKPQDDGYSSQQ